MKTKKRLFALVLTLVLLISMLPAVHVQASEYTATLDGQLDADVSDAVGEWDIKHEDGAVVSFSIGEEVTISMTFPEPVKFTGNWTGIVTDIPISGNADAESTGTRITAFVVDGNDLGARDVPLIDNDEEGFLVIDIARQWGGSHDAYDLAGMEPFTTLEITFVVNNAPTGAEDEPIEIVPLDAGSMETSGRAWIGGTFWDAAESQFDWMQFQDQGTAFNVGEPFVVSIDFGSETQEHNEASWGYITVVQTDIQSSENFYDAYIHSITVDGANVRFNDEAIEVGFDGGVRVALTNGWSDDPVVDGPHRIGEFSNLTVVMAFVERGSTVSFDGVEAPAAGGGDSAGSPSAPAPIEDADDGTSFPMWIIFVVLGVAVVGFVAFFLMSSKKSKKQQ